jgi:hypothetical protein
MVDFVSKANVETELIKLDLGCGQNKQPGFLGVDIAKTEHADFVQDLFKFPWQWKDNSVEEIFASHFFEHVPQDKRFAFMDECWRVLKSCGCDKECPTVSIGPNMFASTPCPEPGGKCTFITPYWSSMRAVQDPTHMWPPICDSTYLYFNKEWRKSNRLDHYPVKCDFNFSNGYGLDQDVMNRSSETQQFWFKHYLNVIPDLHATLIKRGK